MGRVTWGAWVRTPSLVSRQNFLLLVEMYTASPHVQFIPQHMRNCFCRTASTACPPPLSLTFDVALLRGADNLAVYAWRLVASAVLTPCHIARSGSSGNLQQGHERCTRVLLQKMLVSCD